jgi:hypothetical protein
MAPDMTSSMVGADANMAAAVAFALILFGGIPCILKFFFVFPE